MNQRKAPEDPHRGIARRLAADGHRYTSGRRRLVEVLLGQSRPTTLPELAGSDARLPTSSMYRNLELLEQLGLVRRITTGSDHARYELAEPLVGHHHHLICTECGVVEDIRLDDAVERAVERSLHAAAAGARFAPHHHTVDLHGLCAGCQP